MRAFRLWLLLFVSSACVGSEDNPTQVVDLRVLGMRVDPPELMAPACDAGALPEPLAPLTLRALVVDPAQDRPVRVSLAACSHPGDLDCNDEESTRLVLLEEQELSAEERVKGELTRTLGPNDHHPDTLLKFAEGFRLLLEETVKADTYKGYGGIRVPLVLHVRAGDEELYAQKLMVFSCRRVEGQTQNINPELPGLRLEGQDWPPEERPALTGRGPFILEPMDFSDRQEAYVVPSLQLPPKPLHLTESWKVSWHTDHGRLQPSETGGTNFGGVQGRHQVEWLPPRDAARPRERVRVWAVVRDGRGGQSWLERSFRYAP